MPTGIRPSVKLNKILYKIMKTPKSLQQENKEIPQSTIEGWRKENLPTNPGIL
jgi:hypothetical protein